MKIVAAKCISNFYPQNKEYVPGVCVLLFSFVFPAIAAQPLGCKGRIIKGSSVFDGWSGPWQGRAR